MKKTTFFILFLVLSFKQINSQGLFSGSPIADGLKMWLKGDQGVIGVSPMFQWDEMSGAAITGPFIEDPWVWNMPDLALQKFNFNPAVFFDAFDPDCCSAGCGLMSTNSFSGNDIFSPVNNTIYMVKQFHNGGIVDLKWETFPVGDFRIGSEYNNST